MQHFRFPHLTGTSLHILTSHENGYAIVQLNRPEVLNPLNTVLMTELVDAMEAMDKDDLVR